MIITCDNILFHGRYQVSKQYHRYIMVLPAVREKQNLKAVLRDKNTLNSRLLQTCLGNLRHHAETYHTYQASIECRAPTSGRTPGA